MEKKKNYTISVYTENNVGLLHRLSAIFLKRHINIESFNSSMTEIENVQRWTILVITRESFIKKIVGQINKQVEVIQAYYHRDEETIYQESCLFKIKSSLLFDDRKIQNIIKESNAIIVTVNSEFFVIEKSGRTHELDELYEKLNKYGILQYVRSGRIAVTKSPMMISEKLSNFKKQLR
jgi:acetolactate synthase-1/3 small subunit